MDSIEMDKIAGRNCREGPEAEEGSPCLPGRRPRNNSAPQDGPDPKAKPSLDRTAFPSIKFNPPPSKFEQWCMEKTGLSRLGLIVQGLVIILLLIFILVVIIMSCLWPTLPHSLVFPVCRTSACLLASSEMIIKMNQSIDACEDMRQYACGHWLNTHKIPDDKSEWGLKQHMQFKHREKIRDMINTLPFPKDLGLESKVTTIYDSCMSIGTIETEGNRPLKKIISQFGGWQVLRSMDIQTFDYKWTWKTLHAKYNIQPFFEISVVPDPIHPQQSIIQISPGRLGLPDKSYYKRINDKIVKAYKTFLVDVAKAFDANSDDAYVFSEEMFGFEKRLAERFPSVTPDRPVKYRQTIAQLENIASSVPFFDILTAMFPLAKLSKKSEVLVIASDHLDNVSTIISTTDRSTLNNYMILRLAVGYLPYLSKKCRNALDEFHKQLYGYKEQKPRWEMCVETLQKFLGYGLEALLENFHPDPDRKCKVVKDVFMGIKNSTRKAIENSKNLPPHIKDHYLEKIKKIDIQIGLPVSMLHQSYYTKYYTSLVPVKDDFFSNIFQGVVYLLEVQKERLSKPAEEHRWMDIISDGKLKVSYVPEINKVIVPLGLLSMPYFHAHYPPSVLYGALGSEIGHAVLSSVVGKGLLYADDGILLSDDHPIWNITHDCFLHHPLATVYLETLKYTFKALQVSLQMMPHSHQPGMEYIEDQAIFYIAYAQSVCTMRTYEKRDIDVAVKSQLNDMSILQMLMSKSKEFVSTFSCSHPLQKDRCDSLI